MDHLQKYISQVRSHLAVILIINNLILALGSWYAFERLQLNGITLLGLLLVASLIVTLIVTTVSTRYLTQPMNAIWQAILHIAPNTANVPAPNLQQLHLGRELVASLVGHVYQLASVVNNIESTSRTRTPDLHANFVANNLPLPLLVLSKEDTILFANEALLRYIKRAESDVVGQNIYTLLDMSFTNEQTLDTWLTQAKANKAVAAHSWERVKLIVTEDSERTTKLFDLAAYFNRNNPQGLETMLVFFDHTSQYSQDDQALSFVALAVHELRTPLTLLRGYIEVFEEELGGKLDPQLTDFMHKMQASAQRLSAFTNNILNVARFENDQLVLKLQEEEWASIVNTAVSDMQLRARVQGITLRTEIAPDLPTAGADPLSVYEVIINLIDNAIKYSGSSKEIVIRTRLTQEGLIETTVQDFGVGIPENAVNSIFDKFYRNHKNRNQIGGTGMGLYLARAIVRAHGGNIWVRSHEGQGSTFGFTVFPYSKLADEMKTGDNNNIVRIAHGWIKNHSMYRR